MMNKPNWHRPTPSKDISFQNIETDTDAGASARNERLGAVTIDATTGASLQ